MEDNPLKERDLDQGAILDAMPRAVIILEPSGRILAWNKRAEALYGWRADEVLGLSVYDVLVPLPGRDQAEAILEGVGAGQAWQGDFTVLHRSGEPVRVWAIDQAVVDDAGTAVAIVSASEDVTEQRLLEQRAADLTERLRLALDAGGLGTFSWDLATGVTTWDEKVEALFGVGPGGFGGTFESWAGLLHPDDAAKVMQTLDEAVQNKGRYTVQHRVVWPDGSVHWLQGSGQVTLDEAGEVTGTIGCTRDITPQVEAAEQERIGRERLELLSTINDALTASDTREALMSNVTAAVVHRLCDWCAIYVFPHPGARIPDVEVAHVDPEMVVFARELQARFPYDPDANEGMPEVIRSGRASFVPDIDDRVFERMEANEQLREVVRQLGLRSGIAVPLVKRGRVLGGMQFVMSSSRRRYTPDDLTLAEAAAARIAASLDNLRLSEEQRAIASTLQASLLPDELPVIPGLEVAVRYWANGEGIEVGGDFYDVFGLDEGRWAVVIGDVCGTGPAAAAVTGLARHSIASAAWHGDDHATVLRSLNRAMRARRAGPFCTAVYGTLRPSGDGVAFAFASGGHPLPVVARADGSVAMAGRPGSLIGVFDDIDVTTTTTDLAPGDTVVLYTDGATDVSPPHDLSPQAFAELVGVAAREARSAEAVADHLHDALSAILPIDDRDDDIALLVLRVPV